MKISDEYNTWLKITPQTVKKMSLLEIYLDKWKLQFPLIFSRKLSGTKPSEKKSFGECGFYLLRLKIWAEFYSKPPRIFLFWSYSDCQKQFQGKEFPFNEKSKIKVEDIKVYGENENVVIEIQTSGKVMAFFI